MPISSCIDKDIMVKYCLMVLLGISTITFAGMYDYDIQKAQESCESQRRSLLRHRNGTPACDRAKQLIQLKRMEQSAQHQSRPKNTSRPPQKTARKPLRNIPRTPQSLDKRGAGHYWNHHFQRYCNHDKQGYAVYCD